MAFTRFNDDPCRIMKQLQESTDQGRYILNVPGNGDKPCYIDDPYIRLQGWGANLMSNSINIENELRGMTQPINKDCIKENNYNTIYESLFCVWNISNNKSTLHLFENKTNKFLEKIVQVIKTNKIDKIARIGLVTIKVKFIKLEFTLL
jgi:hypothetical protein